MRRARAPDRQRRAGDERHRGVAARRGLGEARRARERLAFELGELDRLRATAGDGKSRNGGRIQHDENRIEPPTSNSRTEASGRNDSAGHTSATKSGSDAPDGVQGVEAERLAIRAMCGGCRFVLQRRRKRGDLRQGGLLTGGPGNDRRRGAVADSGN
ncbi:MAG: hypothetical protein R2862_12660 [Thermoanaerobaculia bacterium]